MDSEKKKLTIVFVRHFLFYKTPAKNTCLLSSENNMSAIGDIQFILLYSRVIWFLLEFSLAKFRCNHLGVSASFEQGFVQKRFGPMPLRRQSLYPLFMQIGLICLCKLNMI